MDNRKRFDEEYGDFDDDGLKEKRKLKGEEFSFLFSGNNDGNDDFVSLILVVIQKKKTFLFVLLRLLSYWNFFYKKGKLGVFFVYTMFMSAFVYRNQQLVRDDN